jgi:hypothetical protein
MQSRLFPLPSKMSLFLPFVAGAASIAAHLLFFKRSEHHLYPIRYLQGLALTFVTSVVTLTHYGAHPWKESVSLSSSIFGYFLAGVYASLITYQLFFNLYEQISWPLFCSTVDIRPRLPHFQIRYQQVPAPSAPETWEICAHLTKRTLHYGARGIADYQRRYVKVREGHLVA